MIHAKKIMFHAKDGFFEEISDKLEKGNEVKFLKEDHIMKYRIKSVLLALFMVLTLPTTALAATLEVNILSYPTKTAVYWDGALGQAVIQPGVAYTGIAP